MAPCAAPAPPPCPTCGGTLQYVIDGLIGIEYAPAFHTVGDALPMRMEPRPFLACTACEYCVQVHHGRYTLTS